MTPTYGSLFTGVGGFDLGFDQAGYDCRWQVEWDKHCQQTLAYHWPNVPRHHDVCDVNGATLQPVDVITYGSPCQDLSVAGKRVGIKGGRSGMFFEAVRIFKEMRDATDGVFPRITVWENVPGALSSNRGADFRAVLTALDDIGALGQWWYVLDAQYFGVPQRRRRVFLVSVFDPAIIERAGNGQILPVGEGRRRNPSTRNKTRQDPPTNVARSIGFSHTQGLDPQPSEVATPTLRSNGSGMAVAQKLEPLVFPSTFSNSSVADDSGIYRTLSIGIDSGDCLAIPIQDGREMKKHQNGLGISEPGSPAYTVDTTGAQAVGTAAIVRRLTPIECERLMGWPDDHTLHRADGKTNSDSTRYKMCGNGVATPVAKWIATNLRKVLEQ